MENEKQKEFILNGNLWKVIFDLSWPAVIAMILLGANNVLDGIFVGHFAEEGAFAGISVALPPIITIIGLGILIGSGAGTLLSIAIGAEDKNIQKKILGNVNFLTLIISVIVIYDFIISFFGANFFFNGRKRQCPNTWRQILPHHFMGHSDLDICHSS